MNDEMKDPACRYVLSVLVKDKVGILRGVSEALADLGGDMDGISQTVLDGYFSLILTVAFPGPCSKGAVLSAVQDALGDDEADVVIRPHDMPVNRPPTVQGARYLVTLKGRRTVGILKAVTNFLATQGINIEEWTVYADGARVTHLGEVTVPGLLDIKQVQDGLEEAVSAFGFTCGIQHENIFLVTNKVGAVRPLLLRGTRDA